MSRSRRCRSCDERVGEQLPGRRPKIWLRRQQARHQAERLVGRSTAPPDIGAEELLRFHELLASKAANRVA